MASLAEMERELIVERTRAGLEVAKQLGRKGGRKPKMTDSKIESAKKLLASGVPPKDVARTLACRFRRSTTGCQPPRTLSVLYFPFSETTPFRALAVGQPLSKDRFFQSIRCTSASFGPWRLCCVGGWSSRPSGGVDNWEGEPPVGWGNPGGVPRPWPLSGG
jgi:hypothetical protein